MSSRSRIDSSSSSSIAEFKFKVYYGPFCFRKMTDLLKRSKIKQTYVYKLNNGLHKVSQTYNLCNFIKDPV